MFLTYGYGDGWVNEWVMNEWINMDMNGCSKYITKLITFK